jgi:hypothetical protein
MGEFPILVLYIMTCSVTNREIMTDILPARMLKLHIRSQVFF